MRPRVQKVKERREVKQIEEVSETTGGSESHVDPEDTQAILDEIEEVLEETGLNEESEASAFVASYHQKGGQ